MRDYPREIAGKLVLNMRERREIVTKALFLFVISLSARGWHAANRLSPRL